MNTCARRAKDGVCVAFFILSLLACFSPASADLLLTRSNLSGTTTATINSATGAVTGWSVGSSRELSSLGEQFYYRLGSTGGQTALSNCTSSMIGANQAVVTYTDPGGKFSMEIDYRLVGGSSSADMSVQVEVDNLTASPLNLNLFHFLDFNLSGLGGTQVAQAINSNTVSQSYQSTMASVQAVAAPSPIHTDVTSNPSSLLALISSPSSPATLSDVAGPVSGDPAWGYQWNVTVPAFGTTTFSEDQNLAQTPEPATLGLLLAGGLMLAGAYRRRRS